MEDSDFSFNGRNNKKTFTQKHICRLQMIHVKIIIRNKFMDFEL